MQFQQIPILGHEQLLLPSWDTLPFPPGQECPFSLGGGLG